MLRQFEWKSSRVKKVLKSVERKINAKASFTRTLFVHRIYFSWSLAQDGEGGTVMEWNFQKLAIFFQVWTQYNIIPKIPKIIMWGAFSGIIYFMFFFSFYEDCCFWIKYKVSFSTSYDLKAQTVMVLNFCVFYVASLAHRSTQLRLSVSYL